MVNHIPLFQIPIISVDIKDWDDKKTQIVNVFKNYPEKKSGLNNFYTNKNTISINVIEKFVSIFNEELTDITTFLKKDIRITDIWTVTYKKGDYQTVHNHGASGLSGIIYLDYDESTPKTMFVQPWNDFLIDETVYGSPADIDKKIILVPTFLNHFSDPVKTNTKKRILSFDLKL